MISWYHLLLLACNFLVFSILGIMSLYDNNTEIIDLAMDIDSDHANSPPQNSCPELISSPNSIYIYPIHSYASQRLNSNPLPNPSPESSTSKAIFSSKQSNHVNKYKHKSIQKKLRVGKDNSLKDFIVDDSEIEEEEVAKGSAISVKKCAELILDHKYDDVSCNHFFSLIKYTYLICIFYLLGKITLFG